MDSVVEPTDVVYDKKGFISTKLGNKISKSSQLSGKDKIIVLGKAIIESGVVIRGDLGSVTIGKNCVICEKVVLRASGQPYKGAMVYINLEIGSNCLIERNTVVRATKIGSYVHIGENCIIGKKCVVKDCCRIEDNTVLTPGTVVPPFAIVSGNPGRIVGRLPYTFASTVSEHINEFYMHFKPDKSKKSSSKTPKK